MSKLLITETEKNKIRKQYSVTQKDYVFDFVITENQKYLILFDNVFVKDYGGKCIGSIWENTHIFDELLQESINKIDNINESIVNEFNEISKKIVWKKDEIKMWLNEATLINEEEGFFDKFISGAKEVGGKILSTISDVAMTAFKKGILPLFRWIRRMASTNIGIVVDAVIAFFSFKSSAVVWFIIVAIDIYEIATGDYDPADPARMQLPFFYLISDLISAVLTSAAGVIFKKAAPVIAKEGLKQFPNLIDYLKKIILKMPQVESILKNVLNVIKKKMPSGSGILGKIINSIGSVLQKIVDFIKRLLSMEGVKAGASGGVALGITKGVEAAIHASGKGEKLGQSVVNANQYLKNKVADITGVSDIGKLRVDDASRNAILSYINNKK